MPFFLVSSRFCGVWESDLIHDSELAGGAVGVCVSVCGVLMHFSVNFIFIWTLQPKGPGVPFY